MKAVIQLNNRKIINGWAFYDWANSAYFLVISTAIFPAYFMGYTDDTINFLGFELADSAFYALIVSIAYVLIALSTPALSGIADYGGKRLYFLRLFTSVGSIACICLYFFTSPETMWIGIIAFMIATIGCAGGLVFYDSYLPDIASEDMYDKVSAKGYTFGYIGSVLLLVFILLIASKPEWFGISETTLPYRISFVLVGLWWLSFSQITFKRMPKSKLSRKLSREVLNNGFNELRKAYHKLKHQPNIRRYLVSFFFYSAGVQTVIYLASAFASKVLGFSSSELIMIILILQIIAIPGAYLFAHIGKLYGNWKSMISMMIIWALICLIAFYVQGKPAFYGLAGLVGLVLGGIQSMSRSTYTKLLDPNESDLTCYYSFYDVLFKLSVVFGTGLFAFLEIQMDDMRYSVLGLAVLFIIGLLIFWKVKIERPIANQSIA